MSDENGAMKALRAERKIRREAEATCERTLVELAQARTEIRQLRVDLDQAQRDAVNWRKAAQARGKALSSANQTTNMLAKVLSERTQNV